MIPFLDAIYTRTRSRPVPQLLSVPLLPVRLTKENGTPDLGEFAVSRAQGGRREDGGETSWHNRDVLHPPPRLRGI